MIETRDPRFAELDRLIALDPEPAEHRRTPKQHMWPPTIAAHAERMRRRNARIYAKRRAQLAKIREGLTPEQVAAHMAHMRACKKGVAA